MSNNSFLDAISIASFIIAIENLKENEEQTESLREHLKEQDGVLNEQTEIYLKKILSELQDIKNVLKGGKNGN